MLQLTCFTEILNSEYLQATDNYIVQTAVLPAGQWGIRNDWNTERVEEDTDYRIKMMNSDMCRTEVVNMYLLLSL